MMKREYRVLVDEEGKAEIRNLDGSEVDYLELLSLRSRLEDRYGYKLYLYTGVGMSDERFLEYKIGISNDPFRRAAELKVQLRQTVSCSANRAWKLEREVQDFFKQWRTTGEWFRFNDDIGLGHYRRFIALKTESEIRQFLADGLPEEYVEDKTDGGE